MSKLSLLSSPQQRRIGEEREENYVSGLLAEEYAHCKHLITAYLSMGLIIFPFCYYKQQSINEILKWIWRRQKL